VPGRLLREVGIEPDRVQRFEVADGRMVTREVGSAVYALGKLRSAAPVIFGRRTDASLLGVVTLEALASGEESLMRCPDVPEHPNYVMFDLEGLPPHLDDLEKVYLAPSVRRTAGAVCCCDRRIRRRW